MVLAARWCVPIFLVLEVVKGRSEVLGKEERNEALLACQSSHVHVHSAPTILNLPCYSQNLQDQARCRNRFRSVTGSESSFEKSRDPVSVIERFQKLEDSLEFSIQVC